MGPSGSDPLCGRALSRSTLGHPRPALRRRYHRSGGVVVPRHTPHREHELSTALRVSPQRRKIYWISAVVVAALIATYALGMTLIAHADTTLISQGKTATASSIENAGTPASAAVDGNTTTTR